MRRNVLRRYIRTSIFIPLSITDEFTAGTNKENVNLWFAVFHHAGNGFLQVQTVHMFSRTEMSSCDLLIKTQVLVFQYILKSRLLNCKENEKCTDNVVDK